MFRILLPSYMSSCTIIYNSIARKFKGFKIHGLLKIASVNKFQVDLICGNVILWILESLPLKFFAVRYQNLVFQNWSIIKIEPAV